MKLQDLATALRRLRLHLDAGIHPTRWSALLDRYDRLLLDAAGMLEVPVPSMARGRHLAATASAAPDSERALPTQSRRAENLREGGA